MGTDTDTDTDTEQSQDIVEESQEAEEAADVVEQQDVQEQVETLKNALEAEKENTAALTQKVLLTKADMENLRKRHVRDLESAHKFALDKFASELLPVIDSLELSVLATQQDDVELARLSEGVDMTLKMMVTAIEKFNLKAVNPVGEKFNPDFHQAMSTQEDNDVAANTVLKVFQKGYTLNDRLVRPAMVVVSSTTVVASQPSVDETV